MFCFSACLVLLLNLEDVNGITRSSSADDEEDKFMPENDEVEQALQPISFTTVFRQMLSRRVQYASRLIVAAIVFSVLLSHSILFGVWFQQLHYEFKPLDVILISSEFLFILVFGTITILVSTSLAF